MPAMDLTGQTYGRLKVIRRGPNQSIDTSHPVVSWVCLCECGNEKLIRANNLRNSTTRSCGCLHRDATRERSLTHNLTLTVEHRAWINLRARCSNPKHNSWEHYGGRGIKVCKRWDKFEHFLEDMGRRPSDTHSIDRINNDGDYTPKNCRWATKSQQSLNQRKRKRNKLWQL